MNQRQIGDEEVEIDNDEDRLAMKGQSSTTTSKDRRRVEIMNHGREKREERSEREERETEIYKRAVGKYKMIFYFFLQSSYSELVLIQAHCNCVSKILLFEIFDGVTFFVR